MMYYKVQRLSVKKDSVTACIADIKLYGAKIKYETRTLYDVGYAQPEKLNDCLEEILYKLVSQEFIFNDSSYCDIRYAYLKALELAKDMTIDEFGCDTRYALSYAMETTLYNPDYKWKVENFIWEGIVLRFLAEFQKQYYIVRSMSKKKDWVLGKRGYYFRDVKGRDIIVVDAAKGEMNLAKRFCQRDAFIAQYGIQRKFPFFDCKPIKTTKK